MGLPLQSMVLRMHFEIGQLATLETIKTLSARLRRGCSTYKLLVAMDRKSGKIPLGSSDFLMRELRIVIELIP